MKMGEKMKTIVHVLNTGSYSGAENVVIQIIKKMNEFYPNQYRMIYMARKGPIEERLKKENIEYYLVDKLSFRTVKQMRRIYSPDIVHAHDFTASILVALTRKNEKIVSHLHNNPLWIRSWNLKTLAYSYTIPKYKSILVVSEAVIDEYIAHKKIQEKSTVVGNPIDLQTLRERQNINDKKIYDIAFLGRLTEQKNPLRFIRIVKQLADSDNSVRAVMIGDGPQREICMKKIHELVLEHVIEMTGFLDNPYELLAKSKILCVTSTWEGFGLMAVEGLALELPVVTTNVGGLKNIVTDECGKLCQTDEQFVHEIEKLLTEKSYYENKCRNAKERAEELDNVEKYMAELNNIYQ